MTLDRLVPHLLLNYPFAPNASLPNGKVPNVLNKYETPLFAAFFS